MLRCYQILVSTIAIGVGVANLSACGQQGSLYLPTEPITAKPPATSTSAPTKASATPPTPAPP